MNGDQTHTQPKRHCMVVHAHYPIGETRVEREARALVDNGYAVDVICLRGGSEPAEAIQDGIAVYRLPVKRHKRSGAGVQLLEYLTFFVLAFFKLAALHRRRRYAVVQVHNLPDFLVFAALLPKLSGARVILDLHDLMPEFYAARFATGLANWRVRLICWQERLSCGFADHVITVTEPWRQTLIQRGVPAEKTSVVMNVADDRVFHRQPPAVSPVVEDGHFNLIYHGNLTQRYGLDEVLRAVDLVCQSVPHIHLTVHGWGDYRQALMDLADELGMGQHVHFSSRALLTAELPELIRSADVGVVPYRRDVFTDGILPTKLMEYVALGVPVIAARTSAISAYFDESMVEFFTPGDAQDLARCILALYSDRARLARLAQAAEKFNQLYNWPAQRAAYVRLVDQLAGFG